MRDSNCKWGLNLRLGVVLAALALWPAVGLAQSARCTAVEAQLAAAEAGTPGSMQELARYEAAIARQRAELGRANDQAMQAGCHAGSGATVCGGIRATIERMQRNLQDLSATWERLQRSGTSAGERMRIENSIREEGCGQETGIVRRLPPPITEAPGPGGSEVRILGGSTGLRSTLAPEPTYRTVCVRLCDGYHFPVSESSPMSLLTRDEQQCRARCPGTQTELHIQERGDQDTADMLSVSTGRRYGDLASAFAHRRAGYRRPEGCACAGENAGRREAGQRGWSELGEALAQPAPEQPQQVPRRNASPDAPVRVVGPKFLPDPEEAIDLQAPAPRSGR